MPPINYDELQLRRERLFFAPHDGIEHDYAAVYNGGALEIGGPLDYCPQYARRHTAAIIGVQLGDEGKGRITDNKIEELIAAEDVQSVAVIRSQGGSNAGHSIVKNGLSLALHQVPSGVLYPQAICIMDSGMVIHLEDLQTEIEYVLQATGDACATFKLAQDATLCTDLERAEEVLNDRLQGYDGGGTKRGIKPAYAHSIDKTGLQIKHLLRDDWRAALGGRYDHYRKFFTSFGHPLATVAVPDFRATKATGTASQRTVGSRDEFLDRLADSRAWLLAQGIVTDTYLLHHELWRERTVAVLFEGAQAVGLDMWLGTQDDVTGSSTTLGGMARYTRVWRPADIAANAKIGVFKATYMSSVGRRRMPTHIHLPQDLADMPADAPAEQIWGAWVRAAAHEYGTTTGRPRDICHLDLPFLIYNARMGGVEVLAATHLDIARRDLPLQVCTHYTDPDGNVIPYKPDLEYFAHVQPHYTTLPGWDGAATRAAAAPQQVPENARKFLAFIQRRTGYPIVSATTGTQRDNILHFSSSS